MFKDFSISPVRILVVFIFCWCSVSAFGQHSFVNTFYFTSDSYKLDKKYFKILDEIGEQCKSDTLIFIKVFAFTDTAGSTNHNDELSKKRAYQVYNYLVSKYNIDTTKIYVTWLGEDSDIYDLHFPEAHAQQRCVDIITNFKRRSN